MPHHATLFRYTLASVGLLMAASAMADAADDAMNRACPSMKAWQDNMAEQHPELTGDQQVAADAKGQFSDPATRDELRRRFTADQNARFAAMAHPDDKALMKAIMDVDADNLRWMRPLFSAKGFPAVSAVGYRGASDAFTLIQHADTDPAFQASMLPLLQKASGRGDISKADLALLTDRVLRHQGKPQRYGSQYNIESTSPVKVSLQPTEDEAHLDQRRAQMNMPPRADYECVLKVMYTPQA